MSLRIGVREIAAELPFAEPQKELASRVLVDSLGRRARVELGQERRGLWRTLPGLDEVGAKRPVELVVEVVGRELGEDVDASSG